MFETGDLNRHLRSIHLQMKPILCPYCNRKFAKQETLLRHLNTAHRSKPTNGGAEPTTLSNFVTAQNTGGKQAPSTTTSSTLAATTTTTTTVSFVPNQQNISGSSTASSASSKTATATNSCDDDSVQGGPLAASSQTLQETKVN